MIHTRTTPVVLVSLAIHAVVIAGAIMLWPRAEEGSVRGGAVTEPALRVRWVSSLLDPPLSTVKSDETISDALTERAEFDTLEEHDARPRVPSAVRCTMESHPPRPGAMPSIPRSALAEEPPRESIEPAEALVPPAALRRPAGIELDARLVTRVQPEFPRPCRRGHGGRPPHGGAVLLEIEVDASGRVGEVRVARPSGCALLDASAVKTGRELRFEAGRRNGVPIPSTERQTIRFSLFGGSE